MRLLLTIPHFDAAEGGAESYAVTVCQELVRRGHAVRVLAATGCPGQGVDLVLGSLAEAPQQVAEFAADLHLDWGLNVPADLHRLGGGTHREYLRLIRESRSPVLRFWRGVTDACRGRNRGSLRREFALLVRPGTHVLANSAFVAAQVRATAPVPEDHIHTLLNGVDTGRFSAARLRERRAATRAELGLAPGDVAFLFVAHNLRLKNFSLLARIFPRIARRCPQAKLVVMGKRRPPFAAPWLVYAGKSRAPEEIFVACDALVHPTFFDACANVVVEAMAAGLPVLTSDRNGSAELVAPGMGGKVLPVVGEQAEIEKVWTGAVLELATSPDLRAAWGKAGREIAETQSIVGYTNRLLDLLEQLAARKQPPPGRVPPSPTLAVANAWVRFAARLAEAGTAWHCAAGLDAAEADWLRTGGFLADARMAAAEGNCFSLHFDGIRGAVSLNVFFAGTGGRSPARLAETGFRLGGEALAKGVPVAEPLAWCRGPGFALLATRACPDAVPLAELAGQMTDDAFLDAAGRLAGRLLAAGFRSPGLDSRRLLARPAAAGWELMLPDLQDARLGQTFDPGKATAMLGWAVPFFQHVPAGEREVRFAAAVGAASASGLTWHGIEREWAEETGAHWRKRRWFRGCTEVFCRPGTACLAAPGVGSALLEELVAAARRGAEGTSVLKHDTKRQLWRVRHDARRYVVKRYVRGAAFGKVNRGRQAWLAAALLQELHIGCAPCLGLLQDTEQDCYLVMEDVGSSGVHTLLKEHPRDIALARRVLALAAAYLALMHRRGVWHRDMKCSNFVVDKEAGRILLCDLEDTIHRRRISERMAVRTFVQFLSYLPGTVLARQRIRFLAAYARERRLPRAEFRSLYAALKQAGGDRIWQGQ